MTTGKDPFAVIRDNIERVRREHNAEFLAGPKPRPGFADFCAAAMAATGGKLAGWQRSFADAISKASGDTYHREKLNLLGAAGLPERSFSDIDMKLAELCDRSRAKLDRNDLWAAYISINLMGREPDDAIQLLRFGIDAGLITGPRTILAFRQLLGQGGLDHDLARTFLEGR